MTKQNSITMADQPKLNIIEQARQLKQSVHSTATTTATTTADSQDPIASLSSHITNTEAFHKSLNSILNPRVKSTDLDLHDLLQKQQSLNNVQATSTPGASTLSPAGSNQALGKGARRLSGLIELVKGDVRKNNRAIMEEEFAQTYRKARAAGLTVSKIQLLDHVSEIIHEKQWLLDLKEKERLGRSVSQLEVLESRVSLEAVKMTGERHLKERELEIVRNTRGEALKILVELFKLQKRLTDYKMGEHSIGIALDGPSMESITSMSSKQ